MFPISGQISEEDTLKYDSPGENHLTGDPTRVFPDLQQILDNNTNADTGACPAGPIAPPVPIPVKECFAEFLPTSDYVGFTGINASPLSLHFRFTARDLLGGVAAAGPDTTLLLATGAGPVPRHVAELGGGAERRLDAGGDVVGGEHGHRPGRHDGRSRSHSRPTAATRIRTFSRRARRTTARRTSCSRT